MDRIGKANQKYEFCKGTLFDAARIIAGIGTSKDIFDPANMTGPIPPQTLFETDAATTQTQNKSSPSLPVRSSPPSQTPSKVVMKKIKKKSIKK